MDTELSARLDRIEQKVDAAYDAANKARRYLLWMVVAGVVGLVLPLLGLLFVIPSFLSSYTSNIDSLSL